MNQKKSNKRLCVLCGQPRAVFPIYRAKPLEKGLCCRFCWGTMVIPARTLLSVVSSPIQRVDLLGRMKEKNKEKAQRGVEARQKWY